MSAGSEIPFQIQRINSCSESRVGGLKDKEYWNCVNRVLESAFKKARTMRASKNPAITQAGIPDSRIRSASANRMAAARPQLDFMATILEAGLSTSERSGQ